MDTSNGNSPEFKFNPGTQYNDSNPTPRPSTSNGNQWQDKSRDRKHAKKREHSQDKEWFRDKPLHGRTRENGKEDEGKDRFREDQPTVSSSQQPQEQSSQQQQPTMQTLPTATTFPNYLYNPADHFNAEANRRQYAMMNPYGLYPMNQWPVNSMEGLNMPANNMAFNPVPTSTGMEGISNGSTNMNNIAPYMMNMPPDASAMYGMMGGMGNYCPYPMMNGQENVPIVPVKEIITLTKSVLYPPNPNAPPPTLREKPPGCKTVFVGGLPEKITEEIIREVFEGCGEILTVRMSKKNFCHIRFALEAYVDKALYLSGYRIKIENKDEAAFSGRLHVDYAIARDDQYEYECNKRALLREARHRERLEQQAFRPPTPPPVAHYSEHEAALIADKIRSEVEFKNAVQVLITWLEKGECNKRNAGTFYSMIQSTNSHVRRLLNDKAKYEDELNKAKNMLRQKMFGICLQFNDIEKVFEAARLQKCWDHFTKAQRKNIELWKKQTSEIKKANSDELIDERIEDEMEVSDGEEGNCPAIDQPVVNEELTSLREQVDDLRNQLSASQQEVEDVKKESEERVDAIRQSFQSASKNLMESQKQVEEYRKLLAQKSNILKSDTLQETESHSDSSHQRSLSSCVSCRSATGNVRVTQSEARLVAVTATFLNVHPRGASIDYICSYLAQFDSDVNTRDVENLMKQFPKIFKEESTGIGATLEKKWAFVGF